MEPIYVSSVEGALVPRYSTLLTPTVEYVGATRGETGASWDPSLIVVIPGDEYQTFKREYDLALVNGFLRRRTLAEYNGELSGGEVAVDETDNEATAEAVDGESQ